MKEREQKRKIQLNPSLKKIKQNGPSTIRWKSWRALQRTIAVIRSDGRCEYIPWSVEHLTWHHVFGRMHIIAEPWASFAPLTFMLCNAHHLAVHSDHNVRLEIERLAVERFCAIMNIPYDDPTGNSDPVEDIRMIVRELEEKGVLPHGYTGNSNT